MTYREFYAAGGFPGSRASRMTVNEADIHNGYCPDICLELGVDFGDSCLDGVYDCRECWDREMPEALTKREAE